MAKIKVLCFGRISDIVKTNVLELEDCSNMYELKKNIFENYPELHDTVFNISHNSEMIYSEEITFKDNDEIALLPPFAGG